MSDKKHYFLMSAEVIYLRGEKENSKRFNVLAANDGQFVNRRLLAQAQQQSQIRFVTEYDPEQKQKVKDVVFTSINYLGSMTHEEFHEGFEMEPVIRAEVDDEATEVATAETETHAE